ncbi:VOC family protein [Actinoalloteichus caeruleus]|uniref:VOC family protein n=1 Tax=Actinoalloteichus cyanogriseus TaxID=2893586 RepID=UPI0004AA5C2E|nr:VOC family protein [Actinoalloteichus caeruleus]
MPGENKTLVWPVLAYEDAPAGIRFLVNAFGFQENVVYPGETPDVVLHAELLWPEGGGVMLGSASVGEGHAIRPGGCAVYLVTSTPDELFDQAVAGGAEVVVAPEDKDYGARGFTVRDPEGNEWSFGTYAGG